MYYFQLLSKIIKTFLTDWYENISNDSELTKEIKLVLRFASSVLLKRLLQVSTFINQSLNIEIILNLESTSTIIMLKHF